MGGTANAVGLYGPRGFESLSLRNDSQGWMGTVRANYQCVRKGGIRRPQVAKPRAKRGRPRRGREYLDFYE